jgi:hypothetical protein
VAGTNQNNPKIMSVKNRVAEPPNGADLEVSLNERLARLEEIGSRQEAVRADLEKLRLRLEERPRFSGDDSAFLIWTLGFTAGANLVRGGEEASAIFDRARKLYLKMPGAGPLSPSPMMGGNGS